MVLSIGQYILWVLSPYITILIASVAAKKKMEAWIVRKIIHVFGLITVTLIVGLNEFWDAFIIATTFTLLFLILSFSGIAPLYQFLIERGTRDGESRAMSYLNSMLTVLIGLILMIIFVKDTWIFMASMLSIAIGDGLGEVIGRPLGRHKYKIMREKSVEGSLAVFIGTFIAIYLPYLYTFGYAEIRVLWIFLIVCLGVVILEAVSWAFLDNLSIPIFVASVLFYSVSR